MQVSEGRGGLVRTVERGGDGLQSRLQDMRIAFGESLDDVSSVSLHASARSEFESASTQTMPTVTPPTPAPAHSWKTETMFTPADLDHDGKLQASSVMRRAFDAVFGASRSGALASTDPSNALSNAPLRRYAAEFEAPVSPGDAAVVTVFLPHTDHVSRRLVRVCFTIDVAAPPAPVDAAAAAADAAAADGDSAAAGDSADANDGTAHAAFAKDGDVIRASSDIDATTRVCTLHRGAALQTINRSEALTHVPPASAVAGGIARASAVAGGIARVSATSTVGVNVAAISTALAQRVARGFVDLELSSEQSKL
jgi:hypothetical protein